MTNNCVENVSSDLSALEGKIIKQVEYYFGDYNLPRDKFLQSKIKEDEGWVAIETLLTFNRLKALSTEENVIVEALRRSTSQLLEVSADGKKIRRSPAKPAPEGNKERQQKLDELTVYAKGFPATATMDELLEFFGQFGVCINVFMRRLPQTRKFKGSVFATFATKEEAAAFLAKEGVKFNELELTRCMKTDYVARKKEERDARQEEKAKKKAASNQEAAAAEEAEAEQEIVLGCLLRLTGLGEKTTWESLKQALAPFAEIAFVDYSRGSPQGVLRFVEEGAAQAVLAKLEAQGEKLKIDDNEVAATVLEGDEETEYWKKMAAARRDKKTRNKGGPRGGGRAGRGRGRGRQSSRQGGDRKQEEGKERKRVASGDAAPAEGAEAAADGSAADGAKRLKVEDGSGNATE